MFITIYLFRVREGQEDCAIALYRDWQCGLRQARGYVSMELLTNVHNPSEFIQIARFEDEESAWAAAECSGHYAWYGRLVALAELGPTVNYYRSVAWH